MERKILILCKALDYCPHEAFSAFTKSVHAEKNFMKKTEYNSEEFLQPLEDSIKSTFLPAVSNVSNVRDVMRRIFS